MIFSFVLLLVASYLVGSVPVAYFVAKRTRGVDIRRVGSGNAGISNVIQTTSKWAAIPVGIFDLGKGALMFFAGQQMGLPLYQQVLAGAAAIAGHNWPLFLGFSGGRGILTTLGVILMLGPKLGLLLAAIAFLAQPLGQMPMAALGDLVALPLCAWFSSVPVINWLVGRTLAGDERLPVTLALAAILVIAVVRRLTPRRVEISAHTPTRELLLNRLVFDRDIRDREAWIHRALLGKKPEGPAA